MNLRGSSRTVEPAHNGNSWSAIPSTVVVGALPLSSVTGAFDIDHMWIGAGQAVAQPKDQEDETAAVLADHPDALQRLARLRAIGSRGRPLSEVAADLGIDD